MDISPFLGEPDDEEGKEMLFRMRSSLFSFSALCNCSSNLLFCEARVEADFSRSESFASSSFTCRSFRSRKARCLQHIVQKPAHTRAMSLRTYAALFCAFLLLCAGVNSFSSLEPLRCSFMWTSSPVCCPSIDKEECPKLSASSWSGCTRSLTPRFKGTRSSEVCSGRLQY